MKVRGSIRIEILLIAAIIIAASLARLVDLKRFRLTDIEATNGLYAAETAGTPSAFWRFPQDSGPDSPLYDLSTSILFQLFGTSEVTARLGPALAGVVALVLLILLIKEPSPLLRLVWLSLLGFSTVFITSSRSAVGDMLAVAALLPILLLILQDKPAESSNFSAVVPLALGIGLCTGRPIFHALSGFIFMLLISLAFWRARHVRMLPHLSLRDFGGVAWPALLIAFLILVGFGGSLAGFRGFAQGLEGWLLGWVNPSGYSFLELIVLLMTSEPLILIFGILGLMRLWQKADHSARFILPWTLGALLFLLLYRGRSPFDLLWVVLPLSYAAAHSLVELIQTFKERWTDFEVLGLLGLLLTLVASGVLSLKAYGTGNMITINPENPNLVLFLFIALAVMSVSLLIFFGVGWSWTVVVQALAMLVLIVGSGLGISSLWRINYSPESPAVSELWWREVPSVGLARMIRTLEHTAAVYSGHRDALPIEVQGAITPSIAWALRDFEQARTSVAFGEDAPPVILAGEQETAPALPSDYIGQSLSVQESRGWETSLPPDIIRWWILREVPVQKDIWVLFVRADIASFGELSLQE